MSVVEMPVALMSPEARYPGGPAEAEQAIINLREIKSILYLGVKGKIPVPAAESHRVDTYA